MFTTEEFHTNNGVRNYFLTIPLSFICQVINKLIIFYDFFHVNPYSLLSKVTYLQRVPKEHENKKTTWRLQIDIIKK